MGLAFQPAHEHRQVCGNRIADYFGQFRPQSPRKRLQDHSIKGSGGIMALEEPCPPPDKLALCRKPDTTRFVQGGIK